MAVRPGFAFNQARRSSPKLAAKDLRNSRSEVSDLEVDDVSLKFTVCVIYVFQGFMIASDFTEVAKKLC